MSMMTKYKDFDFTLFVKLNKETTISTRINSYYSSNRAPLYIHMISYLSFFKKKSKITNKRPFTKKKFSTIAQEPERRYT